MEKANNETNNEYWSMTEGVFNCLIDKKRTLAFKKAIKNTVKKGDVVVDMGTGTGILAMFAADAGAKIVYAIEYDEKNFITLEKTFLVNGYKDKIQLIKGDVREVKIPEKVDVVVGEMIATGLIEELQIPAMNNILKYVNTSYRVVLSEYENYIDLVFNKSLYYGKKFLINRYEYPDEKELKSKEFSNKVLLNKVNFRQINNNVAVSKELSINITKKGIINGIRISSKSVFDDKTSFDSSFAYSYPIILPIEDTFVEKNDVFKVTITYKMCGGFNNLNYTISKK